MAIFGVMCFIIGVIALGALVVRRGQKRPQSGIDHLLVFLGTAGPIIGIGVIFMRFS